MLAGYWGRLQTRIPFAEKLYFGGFGLFSCWFITLHRLILTDSEVRLYQMLIRCRNVDPSLLFSFFSDRINLLIMTLDRNYVVQFF